MTSLAPCYGWQRSVVSLQCIQGYLDVRPCSDSIVGRLAVKLDCPKDGQAGSHSQFSDKVNPLHFNADPACIHSGGQMCSTHVCQPYVLDLQQATCMWASARRPASQARHTRCAPAVQMKTLSCVPHKLRSGAQQGLCTDAWSVMVSCQAAGPQRSQRSTGAGGGPSQADAHAA